MADPVDPNNISSNAGQANIDLDKLYEKLNKVRDAVGSLAGKASSLSGFSLEFGKASEQANKFFDQIKNVEQNIDGSILFNSALEFPFIQKLLGADKAFEAFTQAGVKSSYQVSTAYSQASEVIVKAIGLISNKSVGEARNITSIGQSWYDSAQQAREFENSILHQAAAAGNLGEIYKKAGTDLRGLSDITASWRERLASTAAATGIGIPQVKEFAATLSKVPQAMDNIVNLGAGRNIDMLTASLLIANGTQRESASVSKELAEAYNKFGRSGLTALTVLTDISSVAKTMNLPLSTVEDSVKNVAEQFANMGDNTESALKIFQRFSPAMRSAGIAPEQIAATVNAIGQGIRGMDLAQKAFLSSQTGGPGGLSGAYKIENMLREGKVADVAKMAEDALKKQFGGRVITLDQAQQNEGLAAQFTKQVKFLQSGAFGKLASSDQDAYKLLDVFKKGSGTEDLKKFGTTSDNLRETLQLSGAVVERNTDAITQLNNSLARVADQASATALERTRQISTTGPLKESLLQTRIEGEREAASTDVLGGSRTRSIDEVNSKGLQSAKQAFDLAKGLGGAVLSQLAEGAQNTVNNVKEASKKKVPYDQTLKQYMEEPNITAVNSFSQPAKNIFEARSAQANKQTESNIANNSGTQHANLYIQCPDCHKTHLQTIVLDEMHQAHKDDQSRAHTGISNRR